MNSKTSGRPHPLIKVSEDGIYGVQLAPGTLGPFGVHEAGSAHPAGGTTEHGLAYIALVPLTLSSSRTSAEPLTNEEFVRLVSLRQVGLGTHEALDATEFAIRETDHALLDRARGVESSTAATTRNLRPGDLIWPHEVDESIQGLVRTHQVAALPTESGVIGLLNLLLGEGE